MMKTLKLIFLLTLCTFCNPANAQQKTSLKDTTIHLNEVEVKAKFITHEPGKDIIDAVQLRKGKTNLVDLLQEVPGLIVTDEKVQVPGKSSVKIMFNGRLKRIPADMMMGVLKSYRASNVAKIEVINTPEAKYDSEGNYGMLNIITGKSIDYVGGELADNIKYEKKWMNTARANFNYSHKCVTASVNSSWTYGLYTYNENNGAFFTDLTRHSSTSVNPRRNNLALNGSFDIMLDSLSTLGVDVQYGSTYTKMRYINTTNTFDNSNELTQTELSMTKSNRPVRNLNVSFYIDRNWSRNNSISLMVDVFRLTQNRDYGFLSQYVEKGGLIDSTDHVYSNADAKLKGASFMLDYKVVLPWQIILSTGLKGSFTTTENGLLYDSSTLPVQDNLFTYDENIYAAYVSLNKRAGNFNFVVSGRYEFTQTEQKPQDGENLRRNYDRFFPTAHIMYSMKNGNTFDLSTRSWVNRPGIQYLNPFESYINTYSISKGNPLVDPSYGFNIQLRNNFVFEGSELTVTLRHARGFKNISQITEMNDRTGIFVSQWRNAYKTRSGHFDVYYTFHKLKWMRAMLLASINYSKSYANSAYSLEETESLYSIFYTDLRFFFDRKRNLSSYVQGSYSGKKKEVTGIWEPTYNLGCGINYTCLDNKLNMRIGISNLIASKVSGTAYSNDGMRIEFSNKYSMRGMFVSASYNFGKSIRVKKRESSSSDILERF